MKLFFFMAIIVSLLVDHVDSQACSTSASDFFGLSFTGSNGGFTYAVTLGPGGTFDQGSTSVGTYSSFTGLVLSYTAGDFCRPITADRSGTVTLVPTVGVTSPTLVSVTEPSTCVYAMTVNTPCTAGVAGAGGDPHFTTWQKEHYEYHGQCDLVMLKDSAFANGIGINVHIRTKIVRNWSYIDTAAIQIGKDILEIQGAADHGSDGVPIHDGEPQYWINNQYQGKLDTVGGFPVKQKLSSSIKHSYTVDLSSKYPGTSIAVQLYRGFVRVKFLGDHQEAAFGKAVGLMGDFKTGKTFARDGATVLDDFVALGDEWQVLPSEPRLFHEAVHP